MDDGLRRRRRRHPAATTSPFRHGHRGTGNRHGCAGEPIDGYRHGDEHHGHQRQRERERHGRGKFGGGQDYICGRLHGPGGPPAAAIVQITATSQTDVTKSGSASRTITSDITLVMTPNPASVELGATQAFQVGVTSDGHPDTAVLWSLSGAACPNAWTAAGITRRREFFLRRRT
jgi:hypothetical protein